MKIYISDALKSPLKWSDKGSTSLRSFGVTKVISDPTVLDNKTMTTRVPSRNYIRPESISLVVCSIRRVFWNFTIPDLLWAPFPGVPTVLNSSASVDYDLISIGRVIV